jgi:hypothetical protein
MNSTINHIVNQFFQKETIEDVSEDEIRYFIKQYPYAATGRLLLAKKLQITGEKRAFDHEIAATTIYFNNPAWLQFILRPNDDSNTTLENGSGYYAVQSAQTPGLPEHPAEIEKKIDSENELQEERDLAVAKEAETDPVLSPEPVVIPPEEITGDPEPETSTPAAPPPTGADQLEEDPGEELAPAGEEKDLKEQPLQIKFAPVETGKEAEAEDPLVFDPYHTIDYFASQGIRLRSEDYSRDKLGQQLKSFTDWIRSMKRLPEQSENNKMDDSTQQSIRLFAEHSVAEKEVLTESMAEVWVKQGNKEKARLIYQKLSLQNPSKSAYFAAKIEQLKVL